MPREGSGLLPLSTVRLHSMVLHGHVGDGPLLASINIMKIVQLLNGCYFEIYDIIEVFLE